MDFPSIKPSNGYQVSPWSEEKTPAGQIFYQAIVSKKGVLPPPNTTMWAPIVILQSDLKLNKDSLLDLVARKIQEGVSACEYSLHHTPKFPQ
jgi:hypothetical protein